MSLINNIAFAAWQFVRQKKGARQYARAPVGSVSFVQDFFRLLGRNRHETCVAAAIDQQQDRIFTGQF